MRWVCSRRPRNLGACALSAGPSQPPCPSPDLGPAERLDPTPAPSWLSPPPALFRSRRCSWRARRRPLAAALIFGIAAGSGPTRATTPAKTQAGFPESRLHVGSSACDFPCTPGYERGGQHPSRPVRCGLRLQKGGRHGSPVTAGNWSRELEGSLISRAYRSRKAPRADSGGVDWLV